MIEIDGVKYNAEAGFRIGKLKRSFEKLSSDQSGRLQNGEMEIFLIGTFYNYEMTISRGVSCPLAEYDALFDALSAPVPFNTITVPYNQGALTFEAYVTKGSQELVRQARSENYWGPLTISFIAKAPQKTP